MLDILHDSSAADHHCLPWVHSPVSIDAMSGTAPKSKKDKKAAKALKAKAPKASKTPKAPKAGKNAAARATIPALPPDLGLSPLAQERADRGAKLATQVERSWNADWVAPAGRKDPVAILEAESAQRIQHLIPIRYGRMLASPFTFFRGAAAIMAADLAPLPTSNLRAQSSGDAHLLNFGVFAAPDRRLVFDLNDFDQTLPAPIEWDLKRLAASCVIAARDVGAGETVARTVATAATDAYRWAMWRFAAMRHLEVFYHRIEVGGDLPLLNKRADKASLSQMSKDFAKAETRTSVGSLERFAERLPDGSFRLHEELPLVERLTGHHVLDVVKEDFARYTRTLDPEKAAVIERYRFQDVARKVVGVGSVGIEAYIILLVGDRDDDPLFLQLKEVKESVFAPYAGPSMYEHQGERVVRGQKVMQTTGDLFLGWLSHDGDPSPDYYMRQLRDKKGSIKIERLSETGLRLYAEECGAVLARAHARSGDAATIAGYLGHGPDIADAITEFAVRYADQNELDYQALLQAESDGRIQVQRGL
ncbi:MAG: DUF2252 domain-containing protein [Solirubrobacteraceae bacterium]|nr:DUF2252 domain-containing protein [Solirubrobacteraceae bacterium]